MKFEEHFNNEVQKIAQRLFGEECEKFRLEMLELWNKYTGTSISRYSRIEMITGTLQKLFTTPNVQDIEFKSMQQAFYNVAFQEHIKKFVENTQKEKTKKG